LSHYVSKEIIDKLKTYELVPRSMDDHWIVKVENNQSVWTRTMSQQIAFTVELTTGKVNRGPAFNKNFDDDQIKNLVTGILLGL